MTITATDTPAAERWLDKLQAGDTVIVRSSGLGGRNAQTIRVVEHVTRTQITVNKTKYRRSDGCEMGRDYYAQSLLQATPEAVAAVHEEARRRQLLRAVKSVQWDALSTEVLETAWAAVKASVTKQETETA